MSTDTSVASVYQRDGVYYAKFFIEHGIRTSRNTGMTRKRDAQREAARMEVEALELRRQASDITLPSGIEARRSFHSLRHSFTSWLAEADVHSDIRRKLTGHKSAGMHDLYTHHDESLARAIKELPDLSTTNTQ